MKEEGYVEGWFVCLWGREEVVVLYRFGLEIVVCF